MALGANTESAIVAASGLSTKDAMVALRRLQDHGVITADAEGLLVAYEQIRKLSQETGTAPRPQSDGHEPEAVLHPFVQGKRLIRVPAQPSRRRVVLEHVVANSFEPGVDYDERTVNDRLREWCEGGEVDHVAIRRYLIDMGILSRGNGIYRVKTSPPPEPGAAERFVKALGLG
ncbi:DUF2087 domain-containing protein [Planotetraspora sp. GP83]|uniref:DUF2087 domain-containing protein n=1 Tax=Planotetraspora sp. GP83 TaxID=3156264 RepID=UPI0035161988